MVNMVWCSAQSIVFEQYVGPFSSGISDFAQLQGDAIFIGSEKNGILLSVDDGRSWVLENDGLPNTDVVSVLREPGTERLVAALRDGSLHQYNRSLRRWERMGAAPYTYPRLALAGNGMIYVCDSANSVLASSNSGATWKPVFVPAQHGFSDVLSIASRGDVVVLGTQLAGVYTSTDAGVSWTHTDSRILPVRAVFCSSGGIAFASNTKNLIRSTDGGMSWNTVPTGPAGITSFFEDARGALFAAANSVHVSLDSGLSWQARSGTAGAVSAACTKTGTLLWTRKYRGLLRMPDSSSASEFASLDFPNVPSNVPVPALHATRTGVLLASAESSTYRSTNAGLAWTRVRFGGIGEAGALQIDGDTVGHVFAKLRDSSVWVSDNDGTDWRRCAPDTLVMKGIQQLFVRRNGDVFLSTRDAALWRSVDLGARWSMTKTTGVARALCTPRDGIVVIGTDSGMFRSKDDAVTFSFISNVRGTAFEVSADGTVINAGSGAALLRSTDAGISWEQRYTYPHQSTIGIRSFLRAGDGRLLAGGFGVYLSSDEGGTWIAQGLTRQPQINEWTVLPDGNVLAATSVLGLMVGHWQQSPVSVDDPETATPAAFALSAVWPNPATSASSFRATLRYPALMTARVFSLLGEHIATLCDGMREAGIHTLAWDGRSASGASVPPGIYIISVVADGAMATRPVVLLR